MMEKVIKDALLIHEPGSLKRYRWRLNETDQRLIAQDNNEGILPISIDYTVITANRRDN